MLELSTPEPRLHEAPTTKAQRLAWLTFERTNRDEARTFLTDFGLELARREGNTDYYRDASCAPYCHVVREGPKDRFVGLAFEMATRADLEALTKLEGASKIENATGPGGGEIVRLTDPSGFLVEAVYGQTPAEPLPVRAPLEQNSGTELRRVNEGQRANPTAPEILKLGHVVLAVADYQATAGWYTQRFGFIPSDIQLLEDGSPAIAFLRLNLGATPTDHHTLAIAQNFMAEYDHAAYEVVDLDAVGLGQRHLREKGYNHAWGIGRHLLGSQVFDYWRDPWGTKHEHYCDGDVFSADVPAGMYPLSGDLLSQWGPPKPADFVRPTPSLESLSALVRNLSTSPDLSISKLFNMLKAIN